jgi:diguanylate cyclase (GGDEF)-like protein
MPDRPTAPEDLVAMLDLLAQTIVEALGFGVACINIARPDGTLEVVSVTGDEAARATLLGSRQSAATWHTLLAASEEWGRLRFADHRRLADDPGLLTWVPDVDPGHGEDGWHPADALFAPLTAADGSLLGVLSVDLPVDGRRPGPATRRALEAFVVSAALAIEHATLRARAEASERRYRELASSDVLTGLRNRSMLRERLGQVCGPGQDGLVGLLFLDLDGFKAVNDEHSHEAGDHVLSTVAQRIAAVVRPGDTVARWGGDEFVVLLERLADPRVGEEVAGRVAAAVAEPIPYRDRVFRVTASVGLCVRRATDSFDADDLVRRADAAMYRSKSAARGADVRQPPRAVS